MTGWLRVVVLLGVVSLLGDMSYEGLRGVLPVLEPETLALGALVGSGEAVAWGLRAPLGVLVEALGAYYAAVVLGYLAIPAGVVLALVTGDVWLGYLVERLGKALRGPARDELIRAAVPGHMRGRGFALHELLDQAGAVAGPLLAGAAVAGLAPRWLPALPGLAAALLVAAAAAPLRGAAAAAERRPLESVRASLPAAAAAAAMGLAPMPLAVSHAASLAGGYGALGVAGLYSLSMLSDAAAAPVLGHLYDTRGPRAALALVAASAAAAAAALVAGWFTVAAAFSGVAEAAVETVLRAMARGAAGYGVLGLARGAGAAASITLYGWLAASLHGG